MEVRREDQEKINRFSSLHQKEDALEEELRAKIVRFHVGLLFKAQLLMTVVEGEGRSRGDFERVGVGG
jgi:hypothetical protein